MPPILLDARTRLAAAAVTLMLSATPLTAADNATSSNAATTPMPATSHLVSSIGSERATSGSGGKLLTRDGKTHIVWQDTGTQGDDAYHNMVRTFDHATGTLTDPFTLNADRSNHARPNMVMDYDGYLHAIISGHNSPVSYRRSLRPNDTSAWTDPETIGNGTYPAAVAGKDGTLYVVMRAAAGWNGADLYVKEKDKPWSAAIKLMYRDRDLRGYAAFHGAPAIGDDGVLHVIVNMYEGRANHQDRGLQQALCYRRSADKGKTWTKADGTPVDIPARPRQLDVLAIDYAKKRHEAMPPAIFNAAGNIALDAKQRPHVLFVDRRVGSCTPCSAKTSSGIARSSPRTSRRSQTIACLACVRL